MSDNKPVIMSDATARKVRREHMKLLSEIKKRQDRLWKTSMSSPEFDRIQNRLKELRQELETRDSEFNIARTVLFSPAFNYRDTN
jgi:coenzyme F420-reducing hydrogenase delta subunit